MYRTFAADLLFGWDPMGKEKRRLERLKVKEGAFAAFINPDEMMDIGPIQNISKGGLCVRYLSMQEGSQSRKSIKIFGSNGHFIHLDRVKCRVTYEYEVPEGSWEQMSTRCCGVEFEDLSLRHMSLLEDFIATFAIKSDGQEAAKV